MQRSPGLFFIGLPLVCLDYEHHTGFGATDQAFKSHMKTADLPFTDEQEFDPWLGLAVADTWSQLGRLIAIVQARGLSRAVLSELQHWIDDLYSEREPSEDERAALTPSRLRDFATDVYGLLEQKFRGEPIAADVTKRIATCARFEVRERAEFLDLFEPPDVWWANEYRALFADLVEAKRGKSWLSAVALCANEKCKTFFVKQRSDQRFHNEACRARAANQRSFERRKTRGHNRRAR